MHDGMICGTIVARMVCHLPAPVDNTASRGANSVFSIASVNNLPIMPTEWVHVLLKPWNFFDETPTLNLNAPD